MRSRPDVQVIVRAFNEATTLVPVLDGLIDAGYGVIVVDDGSRDNTFELARSRPVEVVRHPTNLGAGAALQTGIEAALRVGAHFVATFDADGQHRLEDLASCLRPIREGQADVVIGSRFLRPEDRESIPWPRRVLLRGGVVINGLLTGTWMTDAHCGLRAMTRDAASRIRLRERGFAYASELLAEIRRHRLRLVEVPVRVRYTDYSLRKGQSGWNAVNILLDYLSHKVLR